MRALCSWLFWWERKRDTISFDHIKNHEVKFFNSAGNIFLSPNWLKVEYWKVRKLLLVDIFWRLPFCLGVLVHGDEVVDNAVLLLGYPPVCDWTTAANYVVWEKGALRKAASFNCLWVRTYFAVFDLFFKFIDLETNSSHFGPNDIILLWLNASLFIMRRIQLLSCHSRRPLIFWNVLVRIMNL